MAGEPGGAALLGAVMLVCVLGLAELASAHGRGFFGRG